MLPSHRSIDEVWVGQCHTLELGHLTDSRVIPVVPDRPLVTLEHRHFEGGQISSPIGDGANLALRPRASGGAVGGCRAWCPLRLIQRDLSASTVPPLAPPLLTPSRWRRMRPESPTPWVSWLRPGISRHGRQSVPPSLPISGPLIHTHLALGSPESPLSFLRLGVWHAEHVPPAAALEPCAWWARLADGSSLLRFLDGEGLRLSLVIR